jgi:hypothetical protein
MTSGSKSWRLLFFDLNEVKRRDVTQPFSPAWD